MGQSHFLRVSFSFNGFTYPGKSLRWRCSQQDMQTCDAVNYLDLNFSKFCW